MEISYIIQDQTGTIFGIIVADQVTYNRSNEAPSITFLQKGNFVANIPANFVIMPGKTPEEEITT